MRVVLDQDIYMELALEDKALLESCGIQLSKEGNIIAQKIDLDPIEMFGCFLSLLGEYGYGGYSLVSYDTDRFKLVL